MPTGCRILGFRTGHYGMGQPKKLNWIVHLGVFKKPETSLVFVGLYKNSMWNFYMVLPMCYCIIYFWITYNTTNPTSSCEPISINHVVQRSKLIPPFHFDNILPYASCRRNVFIYLFNFTSQENTDPLWENSCGRPSAIDIVIWLYTV